MSKVNENIKALREARHMSQSELAKLTGYSDRSTIAKIETGKCELTQSKINRFAEVLGVSTLELMGEDDSYYIKNAVVEEIESTFYRLSPPAQQQLLLYARFLLAQEAQQ